MREIHTPRIQAGCGLLPAATFLQAAMRPGKTPLLPTHAGQRGRLRKGGGGPGCVSVMLLLLCLGGAGYLTYSLIVGRSTRSAVADDSTREVAQGSTRARETRSSKRSADGSGRSQRAAKVRWHAHIMERCTIRMDGTARWLRIHPRCQGGPSPARSVISLGVVHASLMPGMEGMHANFHGALAFSELNSRVF